MGSCLDIFDKLTLKYRSPTGLVAYGSHYTVVVVDPIELKVIQTLDKHKALIVKV